MKNYLQYLNLLNEKKKIKRKFILLVGPPSIGKSTYIKNNFNLNDYIIIDRDSINTEITKKYGLMYDDAFVKPDENANIGDTHEKYGKVISKIFNDKEILVYDKISQINDDVQNKLNQKFIDSIKSNKNIIIDMTNINVNNRKKTLDIIKNEDFEKIAVVFNNGGANVRNDIVKLARRRQLQIQKEGGKKTLEPHIIDMYISLYEEPTKNEGFDKIYFVNNEKELHDSIKDWNE